MSTETAYYGMDQLVSLYLGELVKTDNLLAVVVAMATLIHQQLELEGNRIVGEGEHHEGQQAAERRS